MQGPVIRDNCRRIAYVLNGSIKYAFLGGAAVVLLGSRRVTSDLDIIVPNGTKARVIERLQRQMQGFGRQEASTRSWVLTPDNEAHNLDILEAQEIYAEFADNTSCEAVDGIRVMRPAAILRTKIISWQSKERKQEKTLTDAEDIAFLVGYMAAHRTKTNRRELDVADEDFFDEWLMRYPGTRESWRAIGMLGSRRAS
ncbi:Hypothetical predicted protein [Lecanosticta acicola]|uniref:Nucleotidyl transferase AbiEii/AbiGii toxin family protein n=1 Tax=Lecanosticta acicola TaxID=111012 RepID=A0AAI8Z4H5_9PEZI|nr:Hypothetical predicted protein [Lecanosticta acicola]